MGGQWSETGTFSKQTHELTDDQVGDLIGEAKEQRDADGADHAEVGVANFYEQALRIIGKWLDSVQPRDVFFFEQGGSFVVRAFIVDAHGKVGHQLVRIHPRRDRGYDRVGTTRSRTRVRGRAAGQRRPARGRRAGTGEWNGDRRHEHPEDPRHRHRGDPRGARSSSPSPSWPASSSGSS